MKSFAILGRQPKIGLAELESLYGADNIDPFADNICLINNQLLYKDCRRFGSVIKVGHVHEIKNYSGWPALSQEIIGLFKKIAQSSSGKLNIGISVYGLNIKPKDIEKTGLAAKKTLKSSGRSIRLIPNKSTALSTAQVVNNKLDGKNGIEIVIIGHNSQVLIGQTVYEQDIESYTARDQARPKRDAYVGMLPPKLAQTVINLAAGKIKKMEDGISNIEIAPSSTFNTQSSTLLDPFCGTGVILQEALLMGCNVIGTDISSKMVDYSKQNIAWLQENYPYKTKGEVIIEQADATSNKWPEKFDFVAAETYLGSPISIMPDAEKLNRLIDETNSLHKKTLVNLASQLESGTRLCLAVPAWRTKKNFAHLPTLDQLGKIGYNRIDFKYAGSNDLIYIRDNQFVGRELVVLSKK